MLEKRNFYINGQWAQSVSKTEFEVINPSTEKACAVITLGEQADTDAAVKAARSAFDQWSQSAKQERLVLLEKLAEIYKRRSDEMAQIISLEMGAPISLSQSAQSAAGYGHIKNFIRTLNAFEFERHLGDHAPNDRIRMEPVGVCGLITPWNWPMNQVTLKVIPALAVGCTVILKPSEIAPLSSMLFAEMIDETGFPAGAFNLVNGDGAGVGTQLSGHADIDMISFTGSTQAGIAISKNAADTVKRVHLELGGKGANIIFADADEKAVKRGVLHCFNNSGQSCNAPTRMLVERSIYEQAVELAKQAVQICTLDYSNKEGRHIGPVVSKQQFEKIQQLINIGIEEGARLVTGGPGRVDGFDQGYFVRPTIFADVSNDMEIARQEIFGPVLTMIPFDNEQDAIDIANDTAYGLTNYIQTKDNAKARRVARRLRTGMVEMNGQFRAAGSPFGGYKQSGNGREGGVWGLEGFCEIKAIGGWDET